jgi:hypothetical protein
LREQHLQYNKNKKTVLNKISELKDEESGQFRALHNDKLCDLYAYAASSTVRMLSVLEYCWLKGDRDKSIWYRMLAVISSVKQP